MFTAIFEGKIVNAIYIENRFNLNPELLSEQIFFADMEQIQEGYTPELQVIFRKSHERNYKSHIGDVRCCFGLLPSAKENGIIAKVESQEHLKAKEFILNILNNPKKETPFIVSRGKFGENKLNWDNVDFNKINIEERVVSRGYRIADIIIPFLNYDELLGYGIVVEIQFSKQSERIEKERTQSWALKGYSNIWYHENDFVFENKEIKLVNIRLVSPFLEIIKDLRSGLGYELAQMSSRLKEISDKINQKQYPSILPNACPKCKGTLILKINNKTGDKFYGCSNYKTKFCNGSLPIDKGYSEW